LLVGGTEAEAFKLPLRLTVSANAVDVCITSAVSARTPRPKPATYLFIDLLPLDVAQTPVLAISSGRGTPTGRSVFRQAIGASIGERRRRQPSGHPRARPAGPSFFVRVSLRRLMDCRVKPGNDARGYL